jgi:hypothetical protein
MGGGGMTPNTLMRYTKGPWKAVKVGDGIFEVRCSNPQKLPVVVIDCHRDGHAPTREVTAPANASLIAAAPELAEMLWSMFAHVSHGGPTRAEAEALLKKAGVL